MDGTAEEPHRAPVWLGILAALAVLVIGGLVGWLIAGGDDAGTKTVTIPAASTVTTTTTVGEQTVAISGTQAPAALFEGGGNANLGALEFEADSTLTWRCPEGCKQFEMTSAGSDNPQLSVSGSGTGGTKSVTKGTYHRVQVKSEGHWTLSFAATK